MFGVSLLAVALNRQIPVTPVTGVEPDGRIWLWIALGVGTLALIAAVALARTVIAADTGTADMQVISNAIREGAEAFLRRQ
jgi:K(+)-stimulated pyrophosphate-energized sodium pump